MLRGMARIGLVVMALFVGLGSDFEHAGTLPSSGTLQGLGDSIYEQLELHKSEMNIAYDGDHKELSANIGTILQAAFAKDDYVAYNVDSYLYTIHTWSATAKIKLNVKYRESATETQEVDNIVRKTLPDLVNNAMPDSAKVRAIHDWIVTHVAYDTSLQHYTAYDALTYGTTVCQGYSLLAYRMLGMAGIESRIVEGNVDSGSHVWNLVRIGGRWRHMDVTWDDPVPDQPGQISYAYFLKTDDQMKVDHRWTKDYPAAS